MRWSTWVGLWVVGGQMVLVCGQGRGHGGCWGQPALHALRALRCACLLEGGRPGPVASPALLATPPPRGAALTLPTHPPHTTPAGPGGAAGRAAGHAALLGALPAGGRCQVVHPHGHCPRALLWTSQKRG